MCIRDRSSSPPGPSTLNAAARLTYNLRRSDHITDALVCLQWLRVPERVHYKLTVLVYKVLHRLAPAYLAPLNYIADLPGRRPLRSASTKQPSGSASSSSLRSSPTGFFSVVGPRIWNYLPNRMTSAESLFILRQLLKTYLYFSIFWTNCFSLRS